MSIIVYLLNQVKPNNLGMLHSLPFCNFLAQLSKLAFWMIGWVVAINSGLLIHFLEVALSPQIFTLKSFCTLWNRPYIYFLVIRIWFRFTCWEGKLIQTPEKVRKYFFQNILKILCFTSLKMLRNSKNDQFLIKPFQKYCPATIGMGFSTIFVLDPKIPNTPFRKMQNLIICYNLFAVNI